VPGDERNGVLANGIGSAGLQGAIRLTQERRDRSGLEVGDRQVEPAISIEIRGRQGERIAPHAYGLGNVEGAGSVPLQDGHLIQAAERNGQFWQAVLTEISYREGRRGSREGNGLGPLEVAVAVAQQDLDLL